MGSAAVVHFLRYCRQAFSEKCIDTLFGVEELYLILVGIHNLCTAGASETLTNPHDSMATISSTIAAEAPHAHHQVPFHVQRTA